MNKRLIITLCLVACFVTACNPQSVPSPTPPEDLSESETPSLSGETPMETPESNVQVSTQTPTAMSDLFLPNCHRGDPETGLPTVTSAGKYEGWYRYANEDYGFALAFPTDWDLIKGQNYVCLHPQAEPTVLLIVGFKRDTEEIAIQRSGVGAGEVITIGTVNFLGNEISRDVLRYEDKDKAILYNYATKIPVGGLVFTLSLDDFRTDYEAVELSPEYVSTADAIVESFELTQ